MRGIALVINAVNVVLRHLADEPDCPTSRALRETALGHINEVVTWRSSLPPLETREALMKRVLALHIAVTKLGTTRPQPGGNELTNRPRGPIRTHGTA